MISTIYVTAKTIFLNSIHIIILQIASESIVFFKLVNSFDIVDSKPIPRYYSGIR